MGKTKKPGTTVPVKVLPTREPISLPEFPFRSQMIGIFPHVNNRKHVCAYAYGLIATGRDITKKNIHSFISYAKRDIQNVLYLVLRSMTLPTFGSVWGNASKYLEYVGFPNYRTRKNDGVTIRLLLISEEFLLGSERGLAEPARGGKVYLGQYRETFKLVDRFLYIDGNPHANSNSYGQSDDMREKELPGPPDKGKPYTQYECFDVDDDGFISRPPTITDLRWDMPS